MNLKEIKMLYKLKPEDYSQGFDFFISTMGNCVNDSLAGIRNIIHNVLTYPVFNDLIEYRDFFQGKKAILVAGGWSLDQNIEHIKRLYGRIPIIACDTGLKILLANGITPNFVTILERVEMCNNLIDVETDWNTPVFVTSHLADPKVFETVINKAHSICGFEDNAVFELSPVKGKIAKCSSSATMALALCDYMGFETVYLFGQDLIYNPDNEKITHSKHAHYGDKQENCYNNQSECVCIDGAIRKTQFWWQLFGNEISRIKYDSKNINFIYNCNKQAMKLDYVDYAPAELFTGNEVKSNKLRYTVLNKSEGMIEKYAVINKAIDKWIKRLSSGEYSETVIDNWNNFVNQNEWLKNILQGFFISCYLALDNREDYRKYTFKAVCDLLRVVSAVFDINKGGIQNFEEVKNEN
jgi:hypothetical protein